MDTTDLFTETQSLSKEEDGQDSGGVLIDQRSQSQLGTHEESFEVLPIGTIQRFTLIPDYKTPTDSKYPIVVRTLTPPGFFCLDGWNLIEEAKDKGENSIICAVETVPYHSQEELAIRKVALRVRPKGGIGFYSEIIRNVTLLVRPRDLENFKHGGDRKTEEFENNRPENIRQVLSFRLGKSITTINQYLNHAYLLSESALAFFVENGVEKHFFEKAQANKRWQINIFRGQGLTDDEITVEISNLMLGWYETFTNTGKIKSVCSAALTVLENEESDHVEATYDSCLAPSAGEEDTINPSTGRAEMPHFHSVQEPPVGIAGQAYSLDDVKHDVETLIVNPLVEANALLDPVLYYEQLLMAAKNLSNSLQMVMTLQNTNS